MPSGIYIRSERARKNIGLKSLGRKHSEKEKAIIGYHSKWRYVFDLKYGMTGKVSPRKGVKLSNDIKLKISNNSKGRTPWNIGIPATKEQREKNRIARLNQKFLHKDTSIEIKVQIFLTNLGIEYYTHKYINIKHACQYDIFIPKFNLVIECDGNYWHSYPTGTEIDHIRTREMIEKGFKVLRLWEVEIKQMNLSNFKERLSREIDN